MNAKVKVVAAIAALQLIVPMAFTQGPIVAIPEAAYQVTGRVLEVTPRTIVIRGTYPNRRDWVIMRREDTRFSSQIRPGDMVNINYNMMATDVRLVTPVPVMPPRVR